MPVKLPPAFDLMPLIAKLQRKHDTKVVGFALSDLLDVASAHGDLLFARELLHTIVLDAQGAIHHPSPYSMAVRGALLAQAILLYARASTTKSARKTFDIRSRLNAEQKAVHDRIARYRNSAIAHFDRESRHGGALWADERVILVPSIPLEFGPVRPALRRLVVRQELVDEILPQTELALEIYAQLLREKFQTAQAKLDDLLRKQPSLIDTIRDHRFDAITFFSSMEQAADFLGPGKRSATLHEVMGPEVGDSVAG